MHAAFFLRRVLGRAAAGDDVIGQGDEDVVGRAVALGEHLELAVDELEHGVEAISLGPGVKDLPELGLA